MFKKKEIFKVKSIPLDPGAINDPKSADDYIKRGMANYARKIFDSAAADLQRAIELNPNALDAYYGLGMVYKATRLNKEAVAAFEKVIELLAGLANSAEVKHEKYEMLRRLALGHVNEIKSGDWNLEKEIWQHIE